MSRFTIGQEITVKEGYGLLEYGKFYPIIMVTDYWNIIVVENDRRVWVDDDYALTREEYEQAEREKDPFAPGKWVVCVEDDRPANAGDILRVLGASGDVSLFRVADESCGCGYEPYRKSHFRPATPEEIKEQEMKIMDEKKADEARANRQTFIVAGQEFYAGQSVFAEYDLIGVPKGNEMEVVGYDANNVDNLVLRHKDSARSFSANPRGRFTTTKPKPHEWKFGDWARHPDEGVCFVMSSVDGDGDVMLGIRDNWTYRPATELTYISTAEIPA